MFFQRVWIELLFKTCREICGYARVVVILCTSVCVVHNKHEESLPDMSCHGGRVYTCIYLKYLPLWNKINLSTRIKPWRKSGVRYEHNKPNLTLPNRSRTRRFEARTDLKYTVVAWSLPVMVSLWYTKRRLV